MAKSLSFSSDQLRGLHEFSLPITEWSEAKHMHFLITSGTKLQYFNLKFFRRYLNITTMTPVLQNLLIAYFYGVPSWLCAVFIPSTYSIFFFKLWR